MSHSPLVRQVSRALLDKRAVWLSSYEIVLDANEEMYLAALDPPECDKRKKAETAWRKERDVAYRCYLLLERKLQDGKSSRGLSASRRDLTSVENLALQPDCMRHALSPIAPMSQKELKDADRIDRLRYMMTWQNLCLTVSRRTRSAFLEAVSPRRHGEVRVAESGCLNALRALRQFTRSGSLGEFMGQSPDGSAASYLAHSRLQKPNKPVPSSRTPYPRGPRGHDAIALAKLLSRPDLGIPTFSEIGRKLSLFEAQYVYVPRTASVGEVPTFEPGQGVYKDLAGKFGNTILFDVDDNDDVSGMRGTIGGRRKIMARLIEKVRFSFLSKQDRVDELCDAVAYIDKRKALAAPFVAERNAYLDNRVFKEKALSLELTNAMELRLGFRPTSTRKRPHGKQ